MLFRSWRCTSFKGGKKPRQVDLNKLASQEWKALSLEQRAMWEALAKEKKKEHETMHPNYKYCPQRSSAKNRVSADASSASSTTTQRRSHSANAGSDIAPESPPYQMIRPHKEASEPPTSDVAAGAVVHVGAAGCHERDSLFCFEHLRPPNRELVQMNALFNDAPSLTTF
ncbi:hypothetical protein GGX14DRAFT_417786 [Mycena pura]|uniref:HMG box domain-containing protein n=1 Tax=Mycena pura TaxID=153505 RepID=A0AAD6YR84_9AGAR|nr:hypothetical protein GGX14DRAFT_417786 [Mycena pura]